MLSFKKILFTSLLFSKIILVNNPNQEIASSEKETVNQEQNLSLEQKINGLTAEYLNILNSDFTPKESLKKLSILKYKAELLLVENSYRSTIAASIFSTLAIPASIYLFITLQKEASDYAHDKTLNRVANIFGLVPLASIIYEYYNISKLSNIYNQNEQLHLLIKNINNLEASILQQN